jgi:hypothetical protein
LSPCPLECRFLKKSRLQGACSQTCPSKRSSTGRWRENLILPSPSLSKLYTSPPGGRLAGVTGWVQSAPSRREGLAIQNNFLAWARNTVLVMANFLSPPPIPYNSIFSWF